MVAPELAPLVKVGGLADAAGSLAKALAGRGHEVRVVLPRYAGLRGCGDAVAADEPLVVHLRERAYARVWRTQVPGSGVRVDLIEHNDYFDSPDPYLGPSGRFEDNARRFGFFARAALDLCLQGGWIPDVIHCHDWPAALLPLHLNTTLAHSPLAACATVLTLHNMQHQGVFPRSLVEFSGLPPETFRRDCLEFNGGASMLKAGIYNTTKITTVSPTYAQEIQTPAGGHGLDALLRFRSADLIGVVNGIDLAEWEPSTDPAIPERFSAGDTAGKASCKAALQRAFGLAEDPSVPVFAVVSRLVDQKGLDALARIAGGLMREMRIQVVLLGSGDPALEAAFRGLAGEFPGQFGATIGFDLDRSHLMFAGSDFLLMPSVFEPCGLSQMYAMRYGSLPVARATGGLIDTIRDPGDEGAPGTGFLYRDGGDGALFHAIGRACAAYYDRPGRIREMQQRAMREDFSWDLSATRYEACFRWAVEARVGAFEAVGGREAGLR